MRDRDNGHIDPLDTGENEMRNGNTLTNEKLPLDRQIVEVRLGQSDWQPATYRDGEFIDIYGMPLERRRITGWRPTANATNH